MPQSDTHIMYDQIVVFIIFSIYIYYTLSSKVLPNIFRSSFALSKGILVLDRLNHSLLNRVLFSRAEYARKSYLSLDATQVRNINSPKTDG
jgi:hypothetical protein